MILFGKRKLGDGAPCFITFEAGATHDGPESAIRLATFAAQAGADAVKFQIFDPDRLVADRKLPFTYEVLVDRETGRTETVTEPLYDILCRRCLPYDEWRRVKQHCDALGLAFFATAGFEEDIDLLVELGCDSIKIASSDVNHFPLIRKAAASGMCLQLDTGHATLGEIESAVDIALAAGNDRIIIHQCPSGYPAHLESINLRIIPTLKQLFPFPVAFSDHSPGWDMDIAAVAVGADLLEKTITLDRTTRSVEHIFSLEPGDMTSFITKIRELETALGSPRRHLTPIEKERRVKYRRSVYLKSPARKGQCLGEAEVDFRRPGFGIGPDTYEALREHTFQSDLPAGHLLQLWELGK